MRIELRVEQKGKAIFQAELGGNFAQFARVALTKFSKEHPEISLLDDDVWLKFGVVR
jgi:hypothetical protein